MFGLADSTEADEPGARQHHPGLCQNCRQRHSERDSLCHLLPPGEPIGARVKESEAPTAVASRRDLHIVVVPEIGERFQKSAGDPPGRLAGLR